MLKKINGMILLSLAFGLTACWGDSKPKENNSTPVTDEVVEVVDRADERVILNYLDAAKLGTEKKLERKVAEAPKVVLEAPKVKIQPSNPVVKSAEFIAPVVLGQDSVVPVILEKCSETPALVKKEEAEKAPSYLDQLSLENRKVLVFVKETAAHWHHVSRQAKKGNEEAIENFALNFIENDSAAALYLDKVKAFESALSGFKEVQAYKKVSSLLKLGLELVIERTQKDISFANFTEDQAELRQVIARFLQVKKKKVRNRVSGARRRSRA